MANYRVTCISKPDKSGSHTEITHIGNNLEQWKLTAEEAIARITGHHDAFYIHDDISGKTFYLAVVNEDGQLPHLRVHADGKYLDVLLGLIQCYI